MHVTDMLSKRIPTLNTRCVIPLHKAVRQAQLIHNGKNQNCSCSGERERIAWEGEIVGMMEMFNIAIGVWIVLGMHLSKFTELRVNIYFTVCKLYLKKTVNKC